MRYTNRRLLYIGLLTVTHQGAFRPDDKEDRDILVFNDFCDEQIVSIDDSLQIRQYSHSHTSQV